MLEDEFPNAIVVKCPDLKPGDLIHGARTDIEWVRWSSGELIALKESSKTSFIELTMPNWKHPGGVVRGLYTKDIEFLVTRKGEAKKNEIQKNEALRDDSAYPHKCPRCGQPAYVSLFNAVDCKAKC